jgi:outer membrane protein assembly factor BamB
MNKKKILLLIPLFITTITKAQFRVFLHDPIQTKSVGYNFLQRDSIIVKQLKFSNYIDDFKVDSARNHLNILFKESKESTHNGLLGVFHLDSTRFLWSQNINLQTQAFRLSDNFLVLSRKKKNYGINPTTGESLWEVDNPMAFTMYDLNVGITFRKAALLKSIRQFYGIDLTSGKELWTIDAPELSNGIGTRRLYRDSTLIVMGKTLFGINVKTGKTWSQAISISEGCMNYSYSGTCYNTSNFLADSTSFILATGDRLIKMNFKGKEIWHQFHDNNFKGSRSVLFRHDKNIYLLNLGYTFIGDEIYTKTGEPFIAKYNENGKKLYMKLLDRHKYITNYHLDGNTLLLIHKKKLTKIDLVTGSLIIEKDLERKNVKEWFDFVGNLRYVLQKDSTYKTMYQTDSTQYYMMTDNGNVNILNTNLDIVGEYDKSQYMTLVHYDKKRKLDFIVNKESLFIIDEKGRKIAAFKNIETIKVQNDTIFLATSDTIFQVPLSNLTP